MKKNSQNRRTFIKNAGRASIAAGIGVTVLPSFLNAQPSKSISFQQTPLGYAYNALEPAIDAMTMEIHYSKHAAAYAKNLGEAIVAENINTAYSLEDVLKNVSRYSVKLRNNGGGHYNHELFWKSMKPGVATNPSGKLAEAINQSFGSLEAFKTKFADAAKTRFGSGWAWLVVNNDKKLVVGSTPNQDNPLMDISDFKGMPLLGLDVWEHAYYLHYQNKRADYITNWWNIVNWEFVGNCYTAM